MSQREFNMDQWGSLLAILSLDIAVPFFAALKIPVENAFTFQALLHPALTNAAAAFPGSPTDRSRQTLLLLLQSMERPAAKLFVFWAQGAFLGYHADQPEWSAWSTVFRRFSTSQRQRLSFLPDAKKTYFLDGYSKRARVDDIRRQEEEIAKTPLSGWDLNIYLQQQYGVSWESGPFSIIESIIKIVRLKHFAAEFWTILTPEERAEFHNRAQAWITENRVWMPGPLPTLDSLLRTQ